MTTTDHPLGCFTDHADIGAVQRPGSVRYDPERQTFTVAGAGHNLWLGRDGFHLVWKRLRGDFSITARVRFLGDGVDPHRKAGVMFRSSTAADAPHANAVVHGDGLTSLQFRRSQGAMTEELRCDIAGAEVLHLERRGTRITLRAARAGERFTTSDLDGLDLGDEVLVGVFVCSHRDEVVEQAEFSAVRLVRPFPADQVRYRDYLGSRLEILDIDTGAQVVVHETAEPIEAPNWTVDGRALIWNSRGRLFRFDLATRIVRPIDSGFAIHNNNDHVLSPDGRQLAISHHDPADGGRSAVYVMPTTGGTPRRVTPLVPSYLHGWSPDGRFLIYTAERDGVFDIYRIPVEGGDEVRLTSTPGLDDGSEYSPDGRFIAFNSSRTGRMQIWRMAADGSDQEQLTNDGCNDWFPHYSPDGRWLVVLSYGPEIDAGDHPYYQPVCLRLLPAAGGPPRVLTHLYGGQGTINVPSWSPDSRRIAFVSNSGPV